MTTKNTEWEKELHKIMCGYELPHGATFNVLKDFISRLIDEVRKEEAGKIGNIIANEEKDSMSVIKALKYIKNLK
jgi:hypothetical protein